MSRSDIRNIFEELEKTHPKDDLKLKVFDCFLGHPTEIRRIGFMPQLMNLKRPDHLEIFMAAVQEKFRWLKEELSWDKIPAAEAYFTEACSLLQS